MGYNPPQLRYLSFGIILDDLRYPDGTEHLGVLGGGGAQSVWGMAAALGSGEQIGLVAGVGHDLDENILVPLHNAEINLDGLRFSERPTPCAWQILDADGGRVQEWRTNPQHLGAHLAKSWDLLPEHYQAAEGFHWGVHPETPSEFAAELHAKGKTVSLEAFRGVDQALKPDQLRALLNPCHIFSANWEEMQSIFGTDDPLTMARIAAAMDVNYLTIRKGAAGADVYDLCAQRFYTLPTIQTQIIEEVGAGNAFCGAFLARLGDGVPEAAAHAIVAASYLIEQVGLPQNLPDQADYESRLALARASIQETSWE